MERLVILGGGESGVGAALLGKKHGFDVFVSDGGPLREKYKEVLVQNEIEWEENQHSGDVILGADVVVKSPGISDTAKLVMQLKSNDISVISEIEFASKFTNSNIIGITGSNGKTTTTSLLHHILSASGMSIGIAGNIGHSFAKQVVENSYKNYVLELSSFQLDGIQEFRPNIAIITNITPDHLDRYDNNFENYIKSKFRITLNQTNEDILIYDGDDPVIVCLLYTSPSPRD